MAENRKRVSLPPENRESSLSEPVPHKKSSSNNDSTAGASTSSFFESVPSKSFTNSTVRPSTSGSKTRLSVGKRKLSVEVADIPLNDDCNEIIEDDQKSIAEKEKSMNKSSNKNEEELLSTTDLSIVKKMSKEQIKEHISRCLQLSTENKINTKNAFALKLIDCMSVIMKNEDKSNFAAMACQLDAGTKIYSSRVDAVHQEVVKLVERCMFASKKKKEEADDNEEEEDNDGQDGQEKEKKKKPKKKVIASNDQISRHLKEKDPKDRFVKLEALPGDILSKARYSPGDLALTLDNHTPFWVNWQQYTTKPVKADGECLIPHIDIKNRKLRPQVDIDTEINLSTLPLLSSKIEPEEEEDYQNEGSGDTVDSDNEFRESQGSSNMDFESFSVDHAPNEENLVRENIEMINLAKSSIPSEGSRRPATPEVMKTLFHEAGGNDYHYLNMNIFNNLWAGPAHWKRPQAHNLAENKKKGIRKKREPVEVLYTEQENETEIRDRDMAVGTTSRKASSLSKKTMAKWSTKKVTYPQDILYRPEEFCRLYSMKVIAEVINESVENPDQEKQDGEPEDAAEDDLGLHEGNCPNSPDMFADSEDEVGPSQSPPTSRFSTSGFKGFPSPKPQSPFDPDNGFRGFPNSPGGSFGSQESLFHGFGSEESNSQEVVPSSQTPTDAEGEGAASGACDVYEGENLVPMVKTVKVDPIRVVAKPNRVDMQHLKATMLNLIRRSIEDQENQLKMEGSTTARGSVAFREVLTQLYSSETLHQRTREDMSIQMAFLCLLTLANENDLNLEKESEDASSDFLIMYDKREP